MAIDPVSIAIEAGLMLASMALTAMQKIQGPRLDSLDVTTADYGTPFPRFWGKRRFEVPIIWAEKLREKKTTQKTKGGKYTNYKYYGTWAVAIADQQIDAVSRIWFDRHLTYDMTNAGPISLGSLIAAHLNGTSGTVKITNGHNMRIYDGTQTAPDPRMESWCEDRYGANTCPAYKDVSYIVFQDIPLEKFGNRIPQISVEAISVKSNSHPYEQEPSSTSIGGGGFAFGGGWMIRWDTDGFMDWFDTPTRAELGTSGPSPGPGAGTVTNVALAADGTAYFYGTTLSDGFNHLYTTTPLGLTDIGVPIGDATHRDPGPCRVFDFPDATRQIYGAGFPFNGTGGYYLGEVLITDAKASRDFCLDDQFAVWTLFQPTGSSNQFEIRNLDTGESFTITGSAAARGSPTTAYFCYVDTERHFFVLSDGYWYLIDRDLGTIKNSGTQAYTTRGEWNSGRLQQSPGTAVSFWSSMTEISLKDGSTIRSLNSSDWLVESLGDPAFDQTNSAIVSRSTSGGTHVTWRYIDRITSNGETLQTVVDDVASWCGLTSQDTAALTQTVDGYSVTQGSGKDMIAPLLDIHDVDPRPHDFTVQFVNRGGSSLGTLDVSEFAREGDEARYVASITQDTDLPRKITFNFADIDHDQQTNNVIAQRPLDAVDATREQTIDVSTYVVAAATAQKWADRYLRRQWIGRQKLSLGLTAQRLALEPADVYNLATDTVTTRARLTKVTLTNGKLQTEWERDGASVHTVGTGSGSSMDGRDPEVIFIPGASRGFVKDTPLIQDADSNANPLLYYAAGPYSSTMNFPGAYFMQGDADGVNFDIEWNVIESTQAATWGYATGALADADPNVWDRGHTVNVKGNLTLSSVTEADIDADPTLNLALLGDELLNFATATLESDGSYTLSDFKRGRRGTEWATSTHANRDDFVLVSSFLHEGMGLSDVGVDLFFKEQTAGRSVDVSPVIEVDFAGRTLMPYAPARLKTYYDGTDLQCTIIRRTRVGGAWVGGSTIPVSEVSEAYEVDVYNGTTLKRTVTVSATNTFTYTSAQATADGITLPTQPTFHVYQMSDAVGRGFALAA